MSANLLKELDRYQDVLTRARKRFAKDGKITKEEQQKLDAIQAKIDLVVNALVAESGAIMVDGSQPESTPPPKLPQDVSGGVKYAGIPENKLANGLQKNRAKTKVRSVQDGLHSVDSWSQQVADESQDFQGQNSSFDAKVNNKKAVEEAFAKDLKRGKFRKLSRAAGGNEFTDSLAAYERASSELKQNQMLLESQAWRLAAAQSMVDQAEMLLDNYELEKKKGAEEKKLAEVKQKLENVKNFVAFYKEVAADPKETAKKLGLKIANDLVDKFLVDVLTGGVYEREIQAIEARISKINQRLDQLKLRGLQSGLEEALSTVKAEQAETKSVWEALDQAKREQGQAIDALATMENNHPGTTTVFGEMQQYFDQVQDAGSAMLESSREYQKILEKAEQAMPYTADLREMVLSDSSDMRSLYSNDWANMAVLEQERQAKAIVKYTKELDTWYQDQQVDQKLAKQHQLQGDLLENQQFLYLGDMINQVQEQGLGHKQRDHKITR